MFFAIQLLKKIKRVFVINNYSDSNIILDIKLLHLQIHVLGGPFHKIICWYTKILKLRTGSGIQPAEYMHCDSFKN